MPSDVEVLRGALELVERDRGWCQGAFCRPRGDTNEDPVTTFKKGWSWAYQPVEELAFCLGGAIRYVARGYTFAETYEDEDGNYQCRRLERRVARHARGGMYSLLSEFNDSENTAQADAIAALKSALVEAEQAHLSVDR